MPLEVPDLHHPPGQGHPLAHREHERPPDAEEFVCGLVVHSYDMGRALPAVALRMEIEDKHNNNR
jgi:hypothetical protein